MRRSVHQGADTKLSENFRDLRRRPPNGRRGRDTNQSSCPERSDSVFRSGSDEASDPADEQATQSTQRTDAIDTVVGSVVKLTVESEADTTEPTVTPRPDQHALEEATVTSHRRKKLHHKRSFSFAPGGDELKLVMLPDANTGGPQHASENLAPGVAFQKMRWGDEGGAFGDAQNQPRRREAHGSKPSSRSGNVIVTDGGSEHGVDCESVTGKPYCSSSPRNLPASTQSKAAPGVFDSYAAGAYSSRPRHVSARRPTTEVAAASHEATDETEAGQSVSLDTIMAPGDSCHDLSRTSHDVARASMVYQAEQDPEEAAPNADTGEWEQFGPAGDKRGFTRRA